MVKLSQFSFRRVLLSRILLLSVPVLLIGETVTYKKARSSLLETARWNLTESAVKKGESITNAIAALKTNLLVASQTTVLQSGSPNISRTASAGATTTHSMSSVDESSDSGNC